jgi:flagellar biosynthesis GTPase FlhF
MDGEKQEHKQEHKHDEDNVDMLKLHNETQTRWDKKYEETVQGIGTDIHVIKEDLTNIKEDVQQKLKEQDEKLKRDYKRFQKQRELNDQFQTRLEVKKELDDARDRQIGNIATRQDNVEINVKDTLKQFKEDDKEHKKEMKEQIKSLKNEIKEGFDNTKCDRVEENKTLKKDITKNLSIVLVIIVPILVALITFALYKF